MLWGFFVVPRRECGYDDNTPTWFTAGPTLTIRCNYSRIKIAHADTPPSNRDATLKRAIRKRKKDESAKENNPSGFVKLSRQAFRNWQARVYRMEQVSASIFCRDRCRRLYRPPGG